ncbi:MAG: glycosyltransferase involved in cell wall biosynthesis [Crocinitomix sp.]|jgi:glycosyltransferase involved in cell wall biosynthesis
MANQQRVIVSVTNDIYTDQRVRKVCEFLVRENYAVTLVGRKLKNSKELPETAYKTKRFPLLFTKGALFYANYNLRLFFFLLFHKADVLLSNDLDTLYANHWARKFKKNCRLVYDSHEYYIGVPELVSRPKVQKFWHKIERKTLPKVDAMYTVNESIADLYRNEYKREVKVVRNISDFKGIKEIKTRKELNLPEDKKIIIIQGAGINIDRGAEEVMEAVQRMDDTILIFVGDGDVVPLLKAKVKIDNLGGQIIFFGKQPYDTLMNYTLLSDVGISMDKDTNVNYRFSLPNKIFDYIHAGIPVLVSDLKEIKHIVETYNVGLVCPSHDPEEIADYLTKILTDETLNATFKTNTKRASQELTWAKECEVLKTIF